MNEQFRVVTSEFSQSHKFMYVPSLHAASKTIKDSCCSDIFVSACDLACCLLRCYVGCAECSKVFI